LQDKIKDKQIRKLCLEVFKDNDFDDIAASVIARLDTKNSESLRRLDVDYLIFIIQQALKFREEIGNVLFNEHDKDSEEFKDFVFLAADSVVIYKGRTVKCTHAVFQTLQELYVNKNCVVRKQDNTKRVIEQIRGKFPDLLIKNIRGVGYKLIIKS